MNGSRCMKRLSKGRFAWGPTSVDTRVPLSARALMILTWHGNPARAQTHFPLRFSGKSLI
jgi:hypothetical protein